MAEKKRAGTKKKQQKKRKKKPNRSSKASKLPVASDQVFSADVDQKPSPEDPIPKEPSRLVPAELVGLGSQEPKQASQKSLATTDPMAAYLAEVRKYPLLTREAEQEYAIRYYESGDSKAAEILVTSNLRFVVKVATEYAKFGSRMIDLVQEGNMGLMQAVRTFNPYKGVRLITYAVWWIKGYIQEYLMKQYSMVRIGTTQNQRKLFYALQREREKLINIGEEIDYSLMSSRLGIPEKEIKSMSERLSSRDLSLNQTVDEDSSTSFLDIQESESEPSLEESLVHSEQLNILKENLQNISDDLNDREHFLLENRLLSDNPLTLQEIGDKYGITREAVRQLENRLIGKIRKAYEDSVQTNSSE